MALRRKTKAKTKTKTVTGSGRTRSASNRKTASAKHSPTTKAIAQPADACVVVEGSDRQRTKGAKRVANVDPGQKIEVTLTLRGPELPSADELGSPTFSARRFRVSYGASRRDVDKVSRVLRGFGLKIKGISIDTRSMRVSGTAGEMEAAFHPNLGIYESKAQGRFRDREGKYEVPASLDEIVTAVLGFGERRVARRRPAIAKAVTKTVTKHRLRPFTPADIETQYHFPPGAAAGERIAIAEFGGGYFVKDLSLYCAKFDRPVPKVKTISIDDAPVRNRAQIKRLRSNEASEMDNTGEVMMDVQVVAGLCPAANISVYFAKDSQKGWVDLLDRVVKDQPVVLSISWGFAEDSGEWSEAARKAINERLNLAAALGITVTCAAGDDGSGDMMTNKRAHVDFPSSSPFVLAVGGTMITHTGKQLTEKVWRIGKGRRVRGHGGATGGGVSVFFDRPKWQNVAIKSVNKNSKDGRVVPDIAALAGPPMYDLVFDGDNDYGGGTSASAPLWAALIARINALLPSRKRQRYLTPLLYQKSSNGLPIGRLACHDISIGHNTSSPNPRGKGYKAKEGFDAVSGWGTPIGTALLLALS